MKVSRGIHCWLEYHNLHSKKSTLKTYKSILSRLTAHFGERDLNSLTPEEVLSFLSWTHPLDHSGKGSSG